MGGVTRGLRTDRVRKNPGMVCTRTGSMTTRNCRWNRPAVGFFCGRMLRSVILTRTVGWPSGKR